MPKHLVDRSPADPRFASDLLLGHPFFKDPAADVRPLSIIAIHEPPPPRIIDPRPLFPESDAKSEPWHLSRRVTAVVATRRDA